MADHPKLEIREVSGRRALKAFIKVPWRIYRDDPNWVPPLLSERKAALSEKHPFFRHAQWQPWIAYRDGEPVGRISAQIDRLHQERYQNATGFFGLIEAIDDADVFEALFETAEDWLRDRGMKNIVGPFNLGINQEVGVLVDGFDTPPLVMTTHSPRYYDAAIRNCGYEPAQDMLAYELDFFTYRSPTVMKELIARTRGQVTIRELDRQNMEADLEDMRQIFNDAWQANWNFVPFTKEEFAAVGKEMLMIVPHDFLQIAEIDGEPAGFIVLLPDINSAIADLNGRLFPFGWARLLWRLKVGFPQGTRIPLMGVKRKFQKTIYGPSMAFMLIESLMKPGISRGGRRVEMSWILESNKPTRNIIEQFGGRITKRYRMYEKALP